MSQPVASAIKKTPSKFIQYLKYTTFVGTCVGVTNASLLHMAGNRDPWYVTAGNIAGDAIAFPMYPLVAPAAVFAAAVTTLSRPNDSDKRPR